MLPFETRRDLYLAFILPHFNYCSETWNFCSKSAADKLERLNERAIRFIFRDKYTSYSELVNALGLPSLKQQRLIKTTPSIFNAVHNSSAPKGIQDLIVHRKNVSWLVLLKNSFLCNKLLNGAFQTLLRLPKQ